MRARTSTRERKPRREASRRNPLRWLGVALLLGASAVGCSTLRGGEDDDPGPVVATVDGREIRQGELDAWLKNDWLRGISQDESQLYQLRRAGLDGVVDDALILAAANAAGLDEEAFFERETAALGPVSDEEIDAFYERNRDRIQPPQPLEALRPRIREFLESDRSVRVVNNLREDVEIEILLEAPPPPPVVRRAVPEGGASRGPVDARVTIVEFSDYQCPFCKRAEATIKQVDALYPGQLRIVYRHLPLDFHADAEPAARAATCAGAQERFWDYHDLLFENQQALGRDPLFAYAEQLELEMDAFRACFDDEATRSSVAEDMRVARELGASATPTFFINGIELRGA